MSLQFYFGPSGGGKSTKVYQDVLEKAQKEPNKRFFILVPDQFTMHTQRLLCDLSESGGILNVEVLSFGRLAHRVFEELGIDALPKLDDTGKNLILRGLSQAYAKELPLLSNSMKKTGFVEEVKSMISELAQYHVTPEALGEMLEGEVENLGQEQEKSGRKIPVRLPHGLVKKLEELQFLYARYLAYIRGNYLTTEESVDLLARHASRSKVLSGSVMVLDGFTGFTPIQYVLLQELLLQAERLVVVFDLDDPGLLQQKVPPENMFYLTCHSVQKLEEIALKSGVARGRDVFLPRVDVHTIVDATRGQVGEAQQEQMPSVARRFVITGESPSINYPLAHLERQLFRQHSAPKISAEDRIAITACPSPKAETEWACMMIKRLIRQEGLRYQDFAVITGDLPGYGYLLRESFAQHEIPLFLDQNVKLLQHPFLLFLTNLLRVAEKNFSYDSVMALVGSCYLEDLADGRDYFERYIREHGVRGKKKYEMPFFDKEEADAAPEQLAQDNSADTTPEQLARANSSAADPAPDRSAAATATPSTALAIEERIDAVRKRIYDLVAPLFSCEKSTRGFTEALYAICAANHLEGRLLAQAEAFDQTGRPAKAKEYSQVYGAVIRLFDQIHALMDEKISRKDYAELLKAGFGELKVGTIPQSVDQVVAGDLERTRLKPVKVLFILGVNDTIIPGSKKSGGFLSDLERRRLEAAGLSLSPSAADKSFEERLYLYINMTQPTQRLLLSYATVDAAGAVGRPAYLVQTLQDLYTDLGVSRYAADSLDAIETKEMGLTQLTHRLRAYEMGQYDGDATAMADLVKLAKAYEEEPVFSQMLEAAFVSYEPVALPKALVEALFGETLRTSISHLETFAGCAYRHFLQYGLRLQEDREFVFAPADLGNLYHEVLCRFGQARKEDKRSWADVPEKEVSAFVAEQVGALLQQPGYQVLSDTKRGEAMAGRLEAMLVKNIQEVAYQLEKGGFTPSQYEMKFSKKGQVELFGKIDRVDQVVLEDTVYVKIVDYKSSEHDFSPLKLWYGESLQLPIYMNGVLDAYRGKGQEVKPAAMLYYEIKHPFLKDENNNPAALEDALHREMRVKGLVLDREQIIKLLDKDLGGGMDSTVAPLKANKDGSLSKNSKVASASTFQLIGDFASYKVGALGKQIAAGDITVSPTEHKDQSACTYCPYKTTCGFEEKIPGYTKRTYQALSEDEVYENMRQSL